MINILCKRNLIYGDCDFILNHIGDDFVVISLGDYHKGHLLDCYMLDADIYFIPAYNSRQFMTAVDKAIETGKTIVVYRPDRLFRFKDFPRFNNIMHRLLIHYENMVIILTGALRSRNFPPPPMAPNFVRHLCDVVAYTIGRSNVHVFYILKHPTLPYCKVSVRRLYGEEFPELSDIFKEAY